MRIENYKIGDCAKLIGYLHDDLTPYCDTYSSHPAVIVCPGGAYEHLSPREQDPVALSLLASGFNVFILHYTIGRENIRHSEPEKEIADSIAFLKDNADKLNIDSDKIAVMGFSAGGHLAASIACHWKKYGDNSRPDCAVLCYPVITMGKYCNKPSMLNLTDENKERVEYFSLEEQVSKDTVPCFIWHTAEDEAVPVENSLMFVQALTEHNISYEYHVYQKGRHGLSAGHRETGWEEKGVQSWLSLCIDWLYRRWDFIL